MSTFKKTKVVMLPTNEKATVGSIVTRPSDNRMAIVNVLTKDDTQPCIHQHLYFLSDEAIKEGDWFLMNNCIIRQCALHKGDVLDTMGGLHHESVCKKIIATTDEFLSEQIMYYPDGCVIGGLESYKILPQPSQLFVEKFVEEYNKGNQITEVMVEYYYSTFGSNKEELISNEKLVPKINPKDNTITIRKVKDSWNREEVVELFNKMFATDIIDAYVKKVDFDKWIEENL